MWCCVQRSLHTPWVYQLSGRSFSPVASGNQDQTMFVSDGLSVRVCVCECLCLVCVWVSICSRFAHCSCLSTLLRVCVRVCVRQRERTREKDTEQRKQTCGGGWDLACLSLVVLKSWFASLISFAGPWPPLWVYLPNTGLQTHEYPQLDKANTLSYNNSSFQNLWCQAECQRNKNPSSNVCDSLAYGDVHDIWQWINIYIFWSVNRLETDLLYISHHHLNASTFWARLLQSLSIFSCFFSVASSFKHKSTPPCDLTELIVLTHLKTISNTTTKYQWRALQYLYITSRSAGHDSCAATSHVRFDIKRYQKWYYLLS